MDKGLFQIFSDAFNLGELQTFLTFLPNGSSLISSLPSEGTPAHVYTREAVAALRRYGLINGALFEELEKQRPYRAVDIQFVKHKWLKSE